LSMPVPTGVTAPNPVITTLCSFMIYDYFIHTLGRIVLCVDEYVILTEKKLYMTKHEMSIKKPR
jgi:hypothetical protein